MDPYIKVFPSSARFPVITVVEATSDGHKAPDDEPITAPSEVVSQTLARRPRVRPLSDQLLGRPRPVGIYKDGDGGITCVPFNDLP